MDITECKSEFEFLGSSVKKLTLTNDFINFPYGENAERFFDVEYSLHDISEHDEKMVGYVDLYVDVLLKSEEKQSKMQLVIEGCFSRNKTENTEPPVSFESLLSVNGCALLYSVARAVLLATTSLVFKTGSVSLPMINCYKLKRRQ